MKKSIIFMKFQNGIVGYTYHKKFRTLQNGQEILLENVSDILIPQEKEDKPLHIPNPWKMTCKEEEIQIFEQHKSNPWLIGKDGHLIQRGTFDGHDISYLEQTYGIGQSTLTLSKYLSRKNYY